MKKILTTLIILLSVCSYAQEYSLLEINAKWNADNNLPYNELSGLKISFAWLEDQPSSIKESVKSVPMLILLHDGRAIHQWQAGIDFKLTVEEKDINKVLSKINKL